MLFSTSGRGLGLAAGIGAAAGGAVVVLGLARPTVVLVGFGALLLVTAATTDFRVVADVSSVDDGDRFALLRGSKVRQAATGFIKWLEGPETAVEKVGSSFVSSQWRIGEQIFTATKRSEKALEEMLTGRHPQR